MMLMIMTMMIMMLMRMVMMMRSHLGLRGAGLKKRVGTADVLVMEINLTAEKNFYYRDHYDENYFRYHDLDDHFHQDDHHAEILTPLMR